MKSKYDSHVKPRFDEIVKWLKRGATDKEIMKALDIKKSAFYNYQNKHKEFKELFKNRINPVEEIKCSLFKRATGFHYQEEKKTIVNIELDDDLKNVLIEQGIDVNSLSKPREVKTEIFTKYALPDVASGVVLLKHWAKDEGWTNDPQTLEIKKKEYELNKRLKEQSIID